MLGSQQLKKKILGGLTESQLEAVKCIDGPLLVLAGAGSGKTRVITCRIGYMMAEGIRPSSIVAVTFTNKAANEMLERIRELLGFGDKSGKDTPIVSTFHSFCAKLLRVYGGYINLSSNFTIYDTTDVGRIIKSICEDVVLPASLTSGKVSSIISYLKIHNIMPDQIEQALGRSDYMVSVIKRIYSRYERVMEENNGLDFTDLLIKALRLFDVDEARERIHDRYRYLLIDEYQDTNRLQYLLAKRIVEHTRNICATGDPDQSIYSWRGADIKNILDFEKDYPDARVVYLKDNFRSTAVILQAANSLIKNNRNRKDKVLVPTKERGEKIKVIECEDELEEANKVVEIIRRLYSRGLSYSEIVVISRVNILFGNIERALAKSGIPYQLARGVSFFQRREIKDLLAYLRVIVNPNDSISLERIINIPPRGIGAKAQTILKNYAERNMLSLYQTIMQADRISDLGKSASSVLAFANLLSSLSSLNEGSKGKKDPACIVRTVLTMTGLYDYYKKQGMKEERPDELLPIAYLDEFVQMAERYRKDLPEGNLEDFLMQLSLVSDVDTLQLGEDRVSLLTMHSAKGLEFKAVIIVGAEENIVPHALSLSDYGEDQLEEERRLFFVSLTRAQDLVYILWTNRRSSRSSSFRYNSPSRFLKELDPQCIDGLDLSYYEPKDNRYQFTIAPKKPIQDAAVAADGRGRLRCPFRTGQRVYHPKFGYGVVQEIYLNGNNYNAHVYFAGAGLKKLVIGIAPLQLVE